MNKGGFMTKLNAHNAVYQSALAIVLMSIIPLLSTVYLGLIMQGQIEPPQPFVLGIIISMAALLAGTGFLIFQKFPKNIIRLRSYITGVAEGVLPENVNLIDSNSSNDLKFIENSLATVVQQMQERIEEAEQQHQLEKQLRETIEKQQKNLVHAEKHRAMVQSLAAACHHIGQPTTALGIRMHIIKRMDLSPEEQKHIDEADKNLQSIMDILDKFRTVSEFRTEPYICTDNDGDVEILAV